MTKMRIVTTYIFIYYTQTFSKFLVQFQTIYIPDLGIYKKNYIIS